MKTLSTTLLTVAAVFAVGVAAAQDRQVTAAMPDAQAMCCMEPSAQMSQMDGHMKTMQALHEQMASATTPEDRQRLKDDQRREMQQCMAMMQAMPHGGSMMGGAGMGTMGQKGKPADQKTQMQMMEKRMDMMHTMMQAMMDQLDASGSATRQASTK
jgi:hypothetical protein